jgi:hypothetical protein
LPVSIENANKHLVEDMLKQVWWCLSFVESDSQDTPAAARGRAPRPTKMGTAASPWRYDGALKWTSLGCSTIQHCAP